MIQRSQKDARTSQVVSYGGLVYIAGQVAHDGGAGTEARTGDVLENIDAMLEARTGRSKFLAVNVFLPAIVDFEAMNSVYDAWVDIDNPPAHVCIEVCLADACLRTEMTAVAAL